MRVTFQEKVEWRRRGVKERIATIESLGVEKEKKGARVRRLQLLVTDRKGGEEERGKLRRKK